MIPLGAMGTGMAFIWAPLGATATRNLPARLAGASSVSPNATRQVGSVFGSANVAAFMSSRVAAGCRPPSVVPPRAGPMS